MVSPGVVPDEVLAGLRAGGADWYALYQETHTPELYERLRVGQPFAARVAARSAARRAGLLVEDGLLTGIGDTAADRARSIAAMRDAAWEQVRVMTFVPQAGTPLADVPPAGDEAELLTIAAMRLAMPDALIPASLDVDGIRGLERRLERRRQRGDLDRAARPSGLAGVSQAELDIDEGHRTVAGVLPHLARLGLRPGDGRRVPRLACRGARARPRSPREAPRRRRQAAGHRGRLPGREGRLGDRPRRPPRGSAGGRARRPARGRPTSPPTRPVRRRWSPPATPCCRPARTCSTLEWLAERVPAWGVPLLFDLDAYRVSASKLASQRLFAELDVPRPLPWPACGFPAVVKPDSASGSEGVSVVDDEAELAAALRAPRGRRARAGGRGVRGRTVALARGPRLGRPRRPAAGHRPRVRRRPTTASASWRRWARPGPEGLRPPAPAARSPGTAPWRRARWPPSTPRPCVSPRVSA